MATTKDKYQQLFGKSGIRQGDVISFSEHGRVGGLSTGQPFKFVNVIDQTTGNPVNFEGLYTTRRVETGGIVYYGEADAGSLESSSVWRIYRVHTVSGVETKEFADGNTNFDNSWNSRESLAYGTSGGSGIGYWAIGSTFVVS